MAQSWPFPLTPWDVCPLRVYADYTDVACWYSPINFHAEKLQLWKKSSRCVATIIALHHHSILGKLRSLNVIIGWKTHYITNLSFIIFWYWLHTRLHMLLKQESLNDSILFSQHLTFVLGIPNFLVSLWKHWNRDASATTFHQLPTKIVTTAEVEPRVITLPPEKI